MTSNTYSDPMYRHFVEVGEADIDMLGHASNLAYLRWVQDVAVAHSEAVGLDYEAYARLGAVFIIRRHEIDYLRSALRGDRLEVRTWLGSVHAAKCERHTEIARVSDGVVLAKACTIWGYVDTRTGRPTRIPQEIYTAFQRERARRAETTS